MIQRIQSLFYLLAGFSFAGLFKFPFATSGISIPQYLADQVYNVMDHAVLIGLTGIGIIVSLAAIFLFKNRSLQLRMGLLAIVISILLPVVAFLLIYTEKTASTDTAQIDDGLGLYLPILSLIFAIVANRFVKKDDKLVKSMDRLR
ncbi:MAG: DUF4293 domain-containing protein [Saprospiraceae bacterium]|nr:DUF4293 domain-containing protein [Saprospiraceae bacterium]